MWIVIIIFIAFVIGKIIAGIKEENKNKAVTTAKFNAYKNNQDKNNVDTKKINMLIDFSTLMAKHIQNNLDINSPLIFYEQVYLLYFLSDIYAVSKNVSELERHATLKGLIDTLNYNHKLDYLINKDDFKNTFTKRYAGYMYVLLHDNYNFSESFFDEVFEYQTAQVKSIKNNNQFTDFDPESNCLANSKEDLKIKSLVTENFTLIDAFMAQL